MLEAKALQEIVTYDPYVFHSTNYRDYYLSRGHLRDIVNTPTNIVISKLIRTKTQWFYCQVILQPAVSFTRVHFIEFIIYI